ncbi:MAG: sulfite exporter TauE/SafE family protein [Chloroflexi bacterium]|nr:sulfite exporter TauE/SafE family protein [Chloroflexota bacterium]
MLDPILVALGLLVGVVVGLTGVGGGALLTPLLIVVAGVRPTLAVGTDLAFAALTKAVGAGLHLRGGSVDLPLTARLAAGSVPGVLLGTQLVAHWERASGLAAQDGVARLLALALLAAALASLARVCGLGALALAGREPGRLLPVGLGFGVGLTVGVTSIGAGSLLMAVLALLYTLPPRRAVGTDIVHGALLAAVGAVAHGLDGRVDPAMLASLLAGSLPGICLGSRLCLWLPSRPLSVGIAALLALSGVQLLLR